jgi:hypothetical protein
MTHTPRAGGGGSCQPATTPVSVGATGIGAPRRLVSGQVSKGAAMVRLELAVPGAAPEPLDLRPLPGGPDLPVNDTHRARGATHHQALRALGNRLVGILHGCLAHQVAYQEQIAWPAAEAAA